MKNTKLKAIREKIKKQVNKMRTIKKIINLTITSIILCLFVIAVGVLLSGCNPDIPKGATCTADGWWVNPQTGEITTTGAGEAIRCEFE